jgi:hypothetical protein
MMNAAGLSIAFHAKPAVRAQAAGRDHRRRPRPGARRPSVLIARHHLVRARQNSAPPDPRYRPIRHRSGMGFLDRIELGSRMELREGMDA